MKKLLFILLTAYCLLPNATQAQMVVNSYWHVVSGGFDADAQAFITATGITDGTQQNAVNDLVLDLKAAGLWSKMYAIYPMVGGTATTHKYNLKDPQDLDASFRLSFFGGWTHSSTGALPNGTNAYANTFFVPSVNGFTTSSGHLSFYSRTNNTSGDFQELGAVNLGTPAHENGILVKYIGGVFYPTLGNTSYPNISSSGSGAYLANRVNTINIQGWINGSKLIDAAQPSSLNTIPLYISGRNFNNSSIDRYSNRECAFVTIGIGLTDTEAGDLLFIINAFQTKLSRNVY